MEGNILTTSQTTKRVLAAGGIAAALLLGGASAATAQDYPNPPSPGATVLGNEFPRGGQVAGEVGSQSVGGGLAVTGADIAGLTAVGAGAIVAGTALVRRGRRRSS